MPKTTSHTHPHDHSDTHTHSNTDDHAHDDHQHPEESVIGPNTIVPLTLPWEKVDATYKSVLTNMAKRVKNPGFRQGKVPAKIAEEIIGFEKLAEETLKKIVPEYYEAALKAKDIRPLTHPEFRPTKLDKGSDWEIEAHVAEKPQVSIKGYEKLAKKGREEAEKEIKDGEKADKKGDKKGDKKETPEEDKKATEERHKEVKLRHIFKELVVGLKPSIPELLVKEETRRELERLIESLGQLNITFDDYLHRRQMDFNQLSGELATQVVSQLQLEFILEAISDDQKVEAKDEDFKPYFERITDEKTRTKYQEDPEYKAYLARVISREKVINQLLDA